MEHTQIPDQQRIANGNGNKIVILIALLMLLTAITSIIILMLFKVKKTQPSLSQRLTIDTPSPKPDTTNITTSEYSNTQLGISLQYPRSWTLQPPHSENEISIEMPPSQECQPPANCGGAFRGITIRLMDNPQRVPLEVYAVNTQDFSYGHFVKNPDSLGLPYEWLIDRKPWGSGSVAQEVLINRGSHVIDIYCGECQAGVVENILKTLKITYQEKDNHTENLTEYHTYKNAVGNYSLLIPPGYNVIENKVVSADGVYIEAPGIVSVISPILSESVGNIVVEIHFTKTENENLESITINGTLLSDYSSYKKNYILPNGTPGLLYANLPVGINGESIMITYRNGIAYTFVIQHHDGFEKIEPEIRKLLLHFVVK